MSAASPPASLRDDAKVITLVGFAHATSHFFHLMIPPLYPWLMEEFGFGFTQVAVSMTVFFVVSSIGQALSGFVVDRLGAFRVLCGGMSLLVASGVLLSMSANFSMLLVAAFVAGLGNSVFHPADFTLLNRRVTTSRLGHAFSVHGLSGSLGWAAAPPLMALMASTAGWRSAGLAAAAVGFTALMVLVLNRRLLTDALPAPVHVAAKAGESGTFSFLRSPIVWLCFVFFTMMTLALGALKNFSPSIFERAYGVTIAAGTTALTAYLLATALGTGVGGFIASHGDRQERNVAMGFTAAALAACALASGMLPAILIPALMFVMGFGAGLAGPSRDMLVRKAATTAFGTSAYGRVYGFTYSGIDVGLAGAPLVFGPMMDAGNYTNVLWGVAILQVLVIFTALNVGRRARK